jgi:hypothetical protein
MPEAECVRRGSARGYRMPGETEEMVKDKPVSLGARISG